MSELTPPLPPTVQIDFTLPVGGGRLKASVTVPAGHTTLTQILPVIQDFSSNIIASSLEILKTEGHEISCRAGCGACCRQMVPISHFEAEALSDWIASLAPDQQQVLRDRFSSALQQLQDRGVLALLGPAIWQGTMGERRALGMAYFQAGVDCPFLVEGSCGIYPIRPLICREYIVTSPAEFCSTPSEELVRRVEIPVKASDGLIRLAGSLEENGRGWLPLVFLMQWMSSGAKPGLAFSGSGPEVFRHFVEALS